MIEILAIIEFDGIILLGGNINAVYHKVCNHNFY